MATSTDCSLTDRPGRSKQRFRTKAAAQKEASKSLSEINERLAGISVAGLCDRFLLEGMKDIRPHSQATYRSFLKRVRMEWADWRVEDMAKDIMAAENWINGYQTLPIPEKVEPDYIAKGKRVKGKVTPARPARDVSNKTKLHLKAFLHRLLECAMKWNLLTLQRNPFQLVEVKGKRIKVRMITYLTGEQYRALVADSELCQHVRVMIQIAMILGLRASEILGLRWEDVDFEKATITIRRSVVEKDMDDTKTQASEAELPMHEDLAMVLKEWREPNQDENGEDISVNGWLFGNILTGRPFWRGTLQKDHLIPAGKRVGIASLGWHDFRHTYRAMMGELDDIPLEMQKTLMRHSDISTTLSYGGKRSANKTRAANAKVVEMLRKRA